MIADIVSNQTMAQVLMYLANYDEGYSSKIAKVFEKQLWSIQRCLDDLEQKGVLVSRSVGRTRLFTWNPRYPLKTELLEYLKASLRLLPSDEIEQYYRERRRPRRKGKKL